jgi:hypothetical protein
VKENKECSGLFLNVLFSKWNLQNQLIMWQIRAEVPLLYERVGISDEPVPRLVSKILRVPGTQLQRVNCCLERRRAQVSCVKWRLEGTKIRTKYTIDGYQTGQNPIHRIRELKNSNKLNAGS